MDKKPGAKILYLTAAFFCLFFLCLAVPSHALEGYNKGEVSMFSYEEETSYDTARAKTLSFGDFSWKITDEEGFTVGKDGLRTGGTAALMKRNPINGAKGFRVGITYSTSSEDGTADAETAFLVMSNASFGTGILMTAPTTTVAVAENGDVYVRGEKINHQKGAAEADVLTAVGKEIAPDEECVLTLQYDGETLSVFLTHGGKKVTLADHYACGELGGLRAFQLGGDKNTEKRIKNALYRAVSFSILGEYVPENTETLEAVLASGEEIREYTSLDKALIDAKESAHNKKRTILKLYKDLTLAHPLEVQAGWDLTLDLNGFTVERGMAGKMRSDGYVIDIMDGAKLTVEDSDPESTRYSTSIRGGVITGGAGSSVGGGILLGDNAVLVMKGGSVVGCVTDDHGGAIRVNGENAKIDITGAGFYGNRTYESSDNCHGGAIYGDNACEITVTSAVFEGNYSEDSGGAIYMNDGKLLMTDCLFFGNKAADEGGAVYLESGSYATMDACRFYQNRADGSGGAVYAHSDEGTRVTGKLIGNTAGESGGAVYVAGDAVCLADAVVEENSAGKNGSGVYVDEMVDLNVQGLLTVKNNINAKNAADDIFLENMFYAAAHIYDGGLYDGSEVFIRADDRGHKVIENVSEYQAAFFKSDSSDRRTVFREDKTGPGFYTLVTSAVGGGDIAFIAVCTALSTAFVVFLILRRRKEKKEAGRK